MATRSPMPGTGAFQWNTGGWFGGQFGGTAWMVVGAAVLAREASDVALVWFVCATAANAVGTWLWLRRDQVRPYPAIQVLLTACGLCGLSAFVALDLGHPDGLALLRRLEIGGIRWSYGGTSYTELLIIPALMAWFAFLDHASRPRSA